MSEEPVDSGPRAVSDHHVRTYLLVSAAYLLLSALIWCHVWSNPQSVTLCGCGDAALFTWFLQWPAHAIAHGLNPFYASILGYPHGVNILANTNVLFLGVLLVPVTWVFGPVATLNVALTISPVLSALAMFVLLRRWTSWTPAAFVGGLLYGFSPFILFTLTNAWLQFGFSVAPPLIVACLDEILVRQRSRPTITGIALGLLVALQFFVGTAVLMMISLFVLIGVALLVAYAAWRRPSALRTRSRFAAVGLLSGGITSVALLAYPLWFTMAGPGHFVGSILPKTISLLQEKRLRGTTLKEFVSAPGSKPSFLNHALGGYLGPILSYQYFGIGLVVVLILGLLVWRRDLRLWFFGIVAAVSVSFSLGVGTSVPLPWQLFQNLPQFENLIPYRFVLITYFAAAVMLGLIVDHARAAMRSQLSSHRLSPSEPAPHPRGLSAKRADLVGVIVAAVALAPVAIYLSQGLPVTTTDVTVPTWFRTAAPRLTGHQVVLALPAPYVLSQAMTGASSLAWQAEAGMDFSMIYHDPGFALGGEVDHGAQVIGSLRYSTPAEAAAITSRDLTFVRRALMSWGTTMVVIPDQSDLPVYDQIPSVTLASAVFTAATGRPPVHRAHAWVWRVRPTQHVSHVTSSSTLARCTSGLPPRGVAAVARATACILVGSSGRAHTP